MKLSIRVAAPGVFAFLAASGCGGGGHHHSVGTLYLSQDSNGNGLYRLDTSTGLATLVGSGISGVTSNTCGLTETDDPDVLIGSTYSDLVDISADGSGFADIGGSEQAEGLAFRTVDGMLYASINGNFYTVDPTTGVRGATLTGPGQDLEGLAYDPLYDQIFGVGNTNDLWVYDVVGDSWSIVGDTGIGWSLGGLAFDPKDRVLYAVGTSSGSNLYRIDPVTAAATLVGPTGLIQCEGGLAFVRR